MAWIFNESGPNGTGFVDVTAWDYPQTTPYRVPILRGLPSGNPKPSAFALLSHDASNHINNALEDLVRSKLPNLSQSCQANVVQKLHDVRGFYVGDFLRYLLKGSHFYYGDESTAPTKGVITVRQSPTLYSTIRDEFKNDHTRKDPITGRTVSYRTQALTSSASFTFVAFFTREIIHDSHNGSNGDNYALLFHEGLHGFGASIINNYYDQDLMKIFGLNPSSGTDEITKYIKANCF